LTTSADRRRPTREQWRDYARTGDLTTRDELVAAYLDLASSLARRFANRGEPLDDLVQVASLALVKAVDRFDPELGFEFSTFATRTVLGELKRHFRDKGWALRAPRRVQELYLEINQQVESLSQVLGRSPTVGEIAAATGATEEAVLEAMEAGRAYRSSSIDAPISGEDSVRDRLGAEDPGFDRVETAALLAEAFEVLSERDREILRLRFTEGRTQSEIAERLGISQMHVSRLLAASLARLRTRMQDGEGP
jgi:RNA polymerase sigma-B factor